MSDDHPAPPARASDADRERVAELLNEALADGRLAVDEHKERIDRLYATKTHAELTPLTADLGTVGRDVERRRSADAVPVERVAPQVAILASTMVRPTGRVRGRMSGVGFFGSARIDLSYATVDEGGVQISAQAIMGSVDIVVPANARVNLTGMPLLGALSPTREPGPADGPRIDIKAVALLGSITVHRAEPEELEQ
ncbi:MAG: DUF1707 domain-containing protein [Streptosporangiales bacterium]|nr:DUF1707 domain-containing protein [Streptosporangiales bacterium]